MTLEQLRAALAEMTKALTALVEKANADGAVEADGAAFDAHVAKIDELKVKIARADTAEKAIKDAALPTPTTKKVAAQAKEPLTGMGKIGIATAALLKASKSGSKSWGGAAKEMDDMGYGDIASEFEEQNKALNVTTGIDGGFAVPPQFNPDILESLMPLTAFLRGGPEIIPMPNGNYSQSAVNARPTAAYRNEGAAIVGSQPTLRTFDMKAKLLSAIIPMTNQIINYTGQRASAMAEREMLKAVSLKIDEVGFTGVGPTTPVGIFNVPGIGAFAAAAGVAPAVGVVDSTVRKALNVIEQFPMLDLNVGWVMTQRVKGYLEDMRDGNGNAYFPGLAGANPIFKGRRVLLTGSVPNNLGAGTNESIIGLVSFGNILLGETGSLKIAISNEATVAGVSAFETDSTYIRATMEHDWEPKYVESIFKLTGIQWGA